MKEQNSNHDEAKLSPLLRAARTNRALPPRFQENVWRRIEQVEAKAKASWLDVFAGWLMRPRMAFAVAAVLVVTGLGLGWNDGDRLARNDAQARYLAAVAPNALH